MRLIKLIGGIVAVVLAAWLQTTWFGHVRPLGVMPNVMLVVIVLFGLWSNASPTLAAAIGGGLLLDLASGSDFGLRTAFFAVVALAIVAGRQYGLHSESVLAGLAIVALGTVLYNVVVLATIGAPIAPVVVQRIGAELIDNEVILLLLMLARVNLGGGRVRATFDLGARLPQ
jgi:rod shape-determining protein MreD